jgi:hypothetical protein
MVENRAGMPGPAAAIPAVAPAAIPEAANRATNRAAIPEADTRAVTQARVRAARWGSGISTKPRSW